MPPLVSVVVPAYNNADFLESTLRSILEQTIEDFELIVADHGSTDGTWDVMRRFEDDSRVSLHRTEAGGGALRNWNRVSQLATGKYLKLVCGDDLLHPEILERQIAALEKESSAVLTASPRSIIDARGGVIISSRGLNGLRGLVPGHEALRRTVRAGTNLFGEPGCVTFRREALEQAGWWDSRWPYFIDEATYAQVLLFGPMVALDDEPLASFRISSGQWSVALARSQASQAAGFHGWLHSTHPAIVRRQDALLGNTRARSAAALRRLAYLYLSRRMSVAGSSAASSPE